MEDKNSCESWGGFKVGDMITTYHKGYYRLDKIVRRFYTKHDIFDEKQKVGDEYSPLFYYSMLYDSNGNIGRGLKYDCDAAFCEKADISIKNEIKKLNRILKNLRQLKKKFSG